jgi:hypothetical protein
MAGDYPRDYEGSATNARDLNDVLDLSLECEDSACD